MIRVRISSDGSSKPPETKGGPHLPGGCAAVIEWPDGNFDTIVAASGELATSIGRMELMGLLVGLKYAAWVNTQVADPDERLELIPSKLSVQVCVDSKYVEKSARGLSGRKKNSDLWREFDRIGSIFGEVSIEHRPRNTMWAMEEADRVAGETRKALAAGDVAVMAAIQNGKRYFTIPPETNVQASSLGGLAPGGSPWGEREEVERLRPEPAGGHQGHPVGDSRD